MINFFLDVLRLINNFIPLFFAIAVLAGFTILLSKSIKKHATVYYWCFSVPFILILVPFFLNMFGADIPRLNGLPVLSYFMRDYVHMGTLGFPFLVIIMYMGALSTRNRYVARLMSIRKELSIIAGFPILTHATLRVFGTFPRGWNFFFNHADYVAERPVDSMAGSIITNFVFVLGIVMLALFLVLWVTSFTSVHRRLGNQRWKKVQRWAYVLYVLLFIHSMGLQIGGMLTRQAREAKKQEAVALMAVNSNSAYGNPELRMQEKAGRTEDGKRGGKKGAHHVEGESNNNATQQKTGNSGINDNNLSHRNSESKQNERLGRTNNAQGKYQDNGKNREEGRGDKENNSGGNKENSGKDGKKRRGIDLSEIKPSRTVAGYIHILSVLIIFGSYLVLRIRKAKSARH